MVIGRYVKTFAEATHALPQGLNLNADYPFKVPRIKQIRGAVVTIVGERGDEVPFVIQRGRDGQEYGTLLQSSSFEKLFGKRPTVFRMEPFKDERTEIPTAGQLTNHNEGDHGSH